MMMIGFGEVCQSSHCEILNRSKDLGKPSAYGVQFMGRLWQLHGALPSTVSDGNHPNNEFPGLGITIVCSH